MTGISEQTRRVMLGILMLTASVTAARAEDAARSILRKMELVADWELTHPDRASVPAAQDSAEPRGWNIGTFYTGLTFLADRSSDPKYARAIFALGERESWGLGPRPFHADDYEVAQNWIWAYQRKHDPSMIATVRRRFDSIVATNPPGSLRMDASSGPDGCFRRWCWSDALFMAPPGWVALTEATHDPRYLAYANKEYRATFALLFDKKQMLFYRDSSYFSKIDANGKNIFWSRGNGWVYAGLARILAQLPSKSPSRGRYADLFKRMSGKIVALQKTDGYWSPSLLDPRGPPETSGTGLFTYGLAWGVKSGLLRDRASRRAAERGWSALVHAVRRDGRIGWVQPMDSAPGAVNASDTQPFGAGAFLLAGAAMCDLALGP